MATILDAANGGATKNLIMYKAYLSYAQLKEYLSGLTENGLLDHEERELKYKTTEKGIHFVSTYDQIGQIVSQETK